MEPIPAADLIPARPTLRSLSRAASSCTACELWRETTQTVFGEGAAGADLMLVGEQPGDREDRVGRPFVGPAGGMLDKALDAVGIDRESIYVTNVVKHFNHEQRGKRRIHRKPKWGHVDACRPWFLAELAVVDPSVLVCLGATAAQALLGRTFLLTHHRGEFIESPLAPYVAATIHPSAVVRISDGEQRELEFDRFVRDLEAATAPIRRERHRSKARRAGAG